MKIIDYRAVSEEEIRLMNARFVEAEPATTMMSTPESAEIIGYRTLSPEEIGLMNSIKLLARRVGNQVENLENMVDVDQRWVAIAKTDLQKGFMALIRAVAQPTTF